MTTPVDRRQFLAASAAAAAAWSASSALAQDSASRSPNEKIVVGVMGVNGRGTALARTFAALADAEVAYVCDVDERAVGKCQQAVADAQTRRPEGVGDFRKLLDDKSVDALVCAAPNHWHGPATILGCTAGKHVYVEKPVSHNAREGELMIEAARKHQRVVTMGTQRRSFPAIAEAVARLHEGVIGEVRYSRGWYHNRRPSIGHGKAAPVPSWLDYELWQGPAARREYVDNVIHYNWHWKWHWGGGELANNGIHALDICRWGLGVDYPHRVSAAGGKYRWDDDQETPDTLSVMYDFGGQAILWEGVSWVPRGREDSMFGMSFHGDAGSLVIDGGGYKIYDPQNKQLEQKSGPGSDTLHVANFLSAIRGGGKPSADITEAHRSTLLCHLGNISYRVGRPLNVDPQSGRIAGDAAAMELWGREYAPGWEPQV